MRFAFCIVLMAAACGCFAQASPPHRPTIVVTESDSISVSELQQRGRSKARGAFADAKYYAGKGDHVRAVRLFAKVVDKDPYFSDARNDLAIELVQIAQPDRAVSELQQAVFLDPHFELGLDNLAGILCMQKRFSEADKVARQALSLSPGSGRAHLYLALALHGEGQRETETKRQLELAAPTNAEAARLLKKWFLAAGVAPAISPD